jgi:RNA polymerase sigma-70 factor (ECF subfamily)
MILTSRAGMEPDVDWRNGGPAAFEMLVRRWQQPVARFLFHLVGREEGVADLCQEVFLRVYEQRARYREKGAFTAWVYRIALNVARDAQRRRRKEPLPLAGVEPADAEPSPDDACEQAERGRIVAQTVAELPEPQRLVVVLRHYEDMSFEQIARLLGEPASTVKSRFSAALQRLRQRLRFLDDAEETARRDERGQNPLRGVSPPSACGNAAIRRAPALTAIRRPSAPARKSSSLAGSEGW